MKSNIADTTEKRLNISLKLYRECKKMMISDSSMRIIINIIEANSTKERELRFRTIGKITDILQKSETEEAFLQKLKREYPELVN